MDRFYYDLIILIKYRKIPYENLDKPLLFSRNEVFCLKIWKLWRAPTTIQFNSFCWNFAYVSYLPMSTKLCSEFSLFCSDLEFFAKSKKTWFLHPRFYIFINNSRSKQNKKIPNTLCRYYQEENVWKISAKNIKLYGS